MKRTEFKLELVFTDDITKSDSENILDDIAEILHKNGIDGVKEFQLTSESYGVNKKIERFSSYKKLAQRIYNFLDKYAGVRPDFDPELGDDEKYTSPDASEMKYCADMLLQGKKPLNCWSEWGNGGYKPYTSGVGRDEHNELVELIYEIINSN